MTQKRTIISFVGLIVFVLIIDTKNIFALPANIDLDINSKINVKKHAHFNKLNSAEIIKILGWVNNNNCDNALCGGYYQNLENITKISDKATTANNSQVNITSGKSIYFFKDGKSFAQGGVTLTQPGRTITADYATCIIDKNTGKISNSILIGQINFKEYGKFIYAEHGDLDFAKHIYILDNGFYRFLAKTQSGLTNIWGQIKHAVWDGNGILRMTRATYTSCPPNNISWHIWSNNLVLDYNKGRGTATNAALFIRKIPVLYTPYLNFSIDNNRKSGFLYPSWSNPNDSGYGISFPYYFNLAPNYDLTLTPTFFSRRGILTELLFRYLLPNSSGNITASYIPNDRVFSNFKNNALNLPANSNYDIHARSVLSKSSPGRGLFGLKNNSIFNKNWAGLLNINYATDDYFLQDFSVNDINKDQLFNEAAINYQNEYWRFYGGVQEFQTLHRMGTEIVDQYKRLPQFSLLGNFDPIGRVNYKFGAQIVNFMRRNYFSTGNKAQEGMRFELNPDISYFLEVMGVSVIPRIRLEATSYNIYQKAADNDNKSSQSQILPLLTIDSNAIFTKITNFFNYKYLQTLEPRLFYLYVPQKNQDSIPNFDTVLPVFDFNQLFRDNRFSGIDRVGDANQIAAAITTRFLDDNGQEKLNASFGQIISFRKHQVKTIDGIDPLENSYISPLSGQFQYFLNLKTKLAVDIAWDPNYHRFNTSNISIQYNDKSEKVFNFWYNYALKGDIYSTSQERNTDLNRIGFSFGWRIWDHWNLLSSLGYDINNRHTQDYLYGLEYDSCCWALRLVRDGAFINNKNTYKSNIYLQFVLKGLGNSNILSNLDGVLPNKISNYNDKRSIGL